MRVLSIEPTTIQPQTTNIRFRGDSSTETEDIKENNSKVNAIMGVGLLAASAIAAYALVKHHNAKGEIEKLTKRVEEFENKNKDLTKELDKLKKGTEEAPKETPKSRETTKSTVETTASSKNGTEVINTKKTEITEASEFEFEMDKNIFTVKDGEIVSCKNDQGLEWVESYKNPNNDGAKTYNEKINAKLAEIKEGNYADGEIRNIKKKAPTEEAPKPEINKPTEENIATQEKTETKKSVEEKETTTEAKSETKEEKIEEKTEVSTQTPETKENVMEVEVEPKVETNKPNSTETDKKDK